MEVKTRKELLEIYDYVSRFHKGLALAKKNGKWSYIHHDGTKAEQKGARGDGKNAK